MELSAYWKMHLHKYMTEETLQLFLGRASGRQHRLCGYRRDVYVFAGLGITQLFARLFFNGLLIALEPLDLLSIAVVLLLHLYDLLAQCNVLRTLLLVDDHSIRAKHDVNE